MYHSTSRKVSAVMPILAVWLLTGCSSRLVGREFETARDRVAKRVASPRGELAPQNRWKRLLVHLSTAALEKRVIQPGKLISRFFEPGARLPGGCANRGRIVLYASPESWTGVSKASLAPAALIFTYPVAGSFSRANAQTSVCAIGLRFDAGKARARLFASSPRLDSQLGIVQTGEWSMHPAGQMLLMLTSRHIVPRGGDTTRTTHELRVELVALSKGRFVSLGSFVTAHPDPIWRGNGYRQRTLEWLTIGDRHVLSVTLETSVMGTSIGGGWGGVAVGGFCTRKTSLWVFDRTGTKLIVPQPALVQQLFRSPALKGRDKEMNCR